MESRARTAPPVNLARSGLLAGASATLLSLLCGCGTIGAPSPPSLELPVPVTDLAASRTADTVHLAWTMPRRTTDKLPIRNNLTVHICRSLQTAACVAVGDPQFSGSKPAHFDDILPPELTAGPPRLLTYAIEVRNHAGHAAGASDVAFSAAGSAPAAVTGLGAEVRADGVLLHWRPASSEEPQSAIRIHRVLTSKAPGTAGKAEKSALSTGSPPPAEETLLVKPVSDADKALDPSAAFDRTYTYRAERVASFALNGHTVAIQGSPSDEVRLSTRDIFPPRPPEGLAVVTVPAEKAIDLSWTTDTEPDLAGYVVFRRDVAAGGGPERISPVTPLPAPAFRDNSAEPEHTYAYSVSAVDEDGNQSAPSPEQQETLPKVQH